LHVFDERAAAVATGDPGRDKSCSVPFGALGVSLPIENSPYAAPDSFARTFFGALSSAFSGAFRHPVPQGICNFLGHTACSGVRIPVGCRFGLALLRPTGAPRQSCQAAERELLIARRHLEECVRLRTDLDLAELDRDELAILPRHLRPDRNHLVR